MTDRDDTNRFGRRSLLVGIGATAAVANALDGCAPPQAPAGSAAGVLGPGAVNVTLRVNGVERQFVRSLESIDAQFVRSLDSLLAVAEKQPHVAGVLTALRAEPTDARAGV